MMRPDKMLTTVATVLALAAATFLSYPVAGATAGFHGAYFSESAFLALQPGQTGQFSVGFSNTGDQAWTRGVAGQSASLHTAAPLDNTTDSVAGWSSGWKAANVYADQLNDLVAPGQIGFFVYNVRVPAAAALGPHTFYGRPFIDGVTPLEDYGYYQIATIVASAYTLVITGTSPATPSTSATPTVSGTGAPPSTTVSILDGSTTVGTAVSGADGTFSVSLSTGLSVGAHALTAAASGGTTSAAYTYTVSSTSTGGSTTTTSSGSLTLSRPGTYSIIITFPRTITGGSAVAANFKFDSASFPTAPTLQTGSLAVRLDFPSGSLPAAGTHSLDVYAIAYVDGTAYTPNPTSFTVSIAADTITPTMSSVVAVSANTIDVTFSEAMRSTTYFPAASAIDAVARYALTNTVDGSAATTTGVAGGPAIAISSATTGGTSSDTTLFNETKARLALSASLSGAASYTLTATSVADQAGNAISSTSMAFTYSASTSLPTASSVTATQLGLVVTYSKAMAHAASGTAVGTYVLGATSGNTAIPVTCAGAGGQIDTKANYALQGAMGTALASGLTKCAISADERTVTFVFDPTFGYVQGTYTYSIAAVTDNVSSTNVITPNPTAGSVVAANSAPKLAKATYLSASSFSVTFSEAVDASSTSGTNSGTNPGNYGVTGGSATGIYGDLCLAGGAASVNTADSKTFNVVCTGANGKWGGSGTNTLQVRQINDTDSTTRLSPDPSASIF